MRVLAASVVVAAASLGAAQQTLSPTFITGTVLTGTGARTLTFAPGASSSPAPGDGDADDVDDTSGPFTLAAAASMAAQPPCVKSCFDPASLTAATGCDSVTNDCACFAPDDVLEQVDRCVAACGGGAASAAASLYSAYCQGIYGQEFAAQFENAHEEEGHDDAHDDDHDASSSASHSHDHATMSGPMTTSSATVTPASNATVATTKPPTVASTVPSQSRTAAPATSSVPSTANSGRGERGLLGLLIGILLPALAL